MAVIYNFLDYKEPKRKSRPYLITGWILGVLSLLSFAILSLSLICGALAIIMGLLANHKHKSTGNSLIFASGFFVIGALLGNYFLNNVLKLILSVFFISG